LPKLRIVSEVKHAVHALVENHLERYSAIMLIFTATAVLAWILQIASSVTKDLTWSTHIEISAQSKPDHL
jgi:hypothetical protein